ncbi:TerC family protein [Sphaerisporangium sp. NPDC088356]|uniref:TerC family protein n=1 Tax=Sphaerisporangium sp. NPDC088356 TaxID=3154871 RepID=UPI0034127595
MDVSVWAWAAVIGGLLVVLAVDLWIVDRGEPREFSMRQAGFWVGFYVGLAVLFGAGLLAVEGMGKAGEFFAGYLTEYSLSVDNLFVFYIIMGRFAVPKIYQHKVLLVGVLMALVMRGIFIVVGAAALERFSWLFYVFGAFLIYTAVNMLRGQDEEEFKENLLLRWVRRIFPTTDGFVGSKITARVGGRRMVTPMLIVMIAIGTTDLLFALDSIPAIFGLTKDAFIVFTANAFALMGLRQLYFLLGGLLQRLVYISYGLSFILGFIGVKLVLEALHTTSGVSWAPEVPIWVSLSVIGVTMVVTTVASLIKARRDKKAGEATAPAKVSQG